VPRVTLSHGVHGLTRRRDLWLSSLACSAVYGRRSTAARTLKICVKVPRRHQLRQRVHPLPTEHDDSTDGDVHGYA
jgi:hypothetical protein